MKVISAVSLLIFSLLAVIESPIAKTGQVIIRFSDCRANDSFIAKQIIIKSETGNIIEKLITSKDNKVKKLNTGNYVMEFTSLFGRKERETFEIAGGDKLKLSACVDKFTADVEPIVPISYLDSLSINQEFQITYASSGCFHNHEDSIQIARKPDGYYIKCLNDWMILSDKQLSLIKDFEFKLVNARIDGGCTTLDLYAIKFKEYHTITNIDGSCRWRGFEYLKKDLNITSCRQFKGASK